MRRWLKIVAAVLCVLATARKNEAAGHDVIVLGNHDNRTTVDDSETEVAPSRGDWLIMQGQPQGVTPSCKMRRHGRCFRRALQTPAADDECECCLAINCDSCNRTSRRRRCRRLRTTKKCGSCDTGVLGDDDQAAECVKLENGFEYDGVRCETEPGNNFCCKELQVATPFGSQCCGYGEQKTCCAVTDTRTEVCCGGVCCPVKGAEFDTTCAGGRDGVCQCTVKPFASCTEVAGSIFGIADLSCGTEQCNYGECCGPVTIFTLTNSFDGFGWCCPEGKCDYSGDNDGGMSARCLP